MDITQITALPVTRQIEIMQEIAAGEAFNSLTYVTTRNLEQALEQLHRDAVDQAAEEDQMLHGLALPLWSKPGSVGL